MLPKDKTFTFGPFTFSRIHGLRRGNRPIPLRHVERQLLKCLLDRPSEIVRKEEIVATLWPASHVSPNTLNVHVRRLRITLKDTTRPHQLLKAVPRMGFMLVANPAPTRTASFLKAQLEAGDKSRFIRDVTIPDGSILTPGERLEKVWEIQNVGSTPWRDRHLRRVGVCSGPGRLTSDPLTVIPATEPGETCLVRLWLTAPTQPGSYYAAWKMVDERGMECLPKQSPLFVSVDVVDEKS